MTASRTQKQLIDTQCVDLGYDQMTTIYWEKIYKVSHFNTMFLIYEYFGQYPDSIMLHYRLYQTLHVLISLAVSLCTNHKIHNSIIYLLFIGFAIENSKQL